MSNVYNYFIEFVHKELNLLPVVLHETVVQGIFSKITEIIRRNLPGSKEYKKFYDTYIWILDGSADAQLEQFLEKDPNFKVLEL